MKASGANNAQLPQTARFISRMYENLVEASGWSDQRECPVTRVNQNDTSAAKTL
jgi:hypothetical protein